VAVLTSLPLNEQLGGEVTQAHLCLQLVPSRLPLHTGLAPSCRALPDGVLPRQRQRTPGSFASSHSHCSWNELLFTFQCVCVCVCVCVCTLGVRPPDPNLLCNYPQPPSPKTSRASTVEHRCRPPHPLPTPEAGVTQSAPVCSYSGLTSRQPPMFYRLFA
jgi:hypothetical protein